MFKYKKLTLEDRIQTEIMDAGNYADMNEATVEDIITTYTDGVAEELMNDLGLTEDKSFVKLRDAIHEVVMAELDMNKVEEQIEESYQSYDDFADAKHSAIY
jgi:hypothetical protein